MSIILANLLNGFNHIEFNKQVKNKHDNFIRRIQKSFNINEIRFNSF